MAKTEETDFHICPTCTWKTTGTRQSAAAKRDGYCLWCMQQYRYEQKMLANAGREGKQQQAAKANMEAHATDTAAESKKRAKSPKPKKTANKMRAAAPAANSQQQPQQQPQEVQPNAAQATATKETTARRKKTTFSELGEDTANEASDDSDDDGMGVDDELVAKKANIQAQIEVTQAQLNAMQGLETQYAEEQRATLQQALRSLQHQTTNLKAPSQRVRALTAALKNTQATVTKAETKMQSAIQAMSEAVKAIERRPANARPPSKMGST